MGQDFSSASFIILTNTDFWDDPPRARHQVTEALSRGYKVTFVSTNRRGLPRLERFQASERLEVITPYFPIDYRIRYRVAGINLCYQEWLFPLLRKEMASENAIVINFDNTATQVFKYFGPVVYYCNDYNIRYYYITAIRRYFERCERIIAEKSLLCVATAKFLTDILNKYNRNVLELRLGAPSVRGELKFARNGSVRIGLVGFLDKRRISLRIMEELVSFPNVEIYIYGLVHPNMKKTLERYSNIKLRGILKGNLLTEDLKSIDVGIAPYRLSDVNPGGTPNKLWLYLAVGKPVVISDLPSIREWQFPSDFVYRAKDDRDFISQVFNAYRKDSIELMNSRACFARENSWANRVRTLLERLFSAMNQEDSTAGFLGDMSKPL